MGKRRRCKVSPQKTISNRTGSGVIRNKVAKDPRLSKGGIHQVSKKAQRARDKVRLRKECDHERGLGVDLTTVTSFMMTFLTGLMGNFKKAIYSANIKMELELTSFAFHRHVQ